MSTMPAGIALSASILAIAIAGVAYAQINPPQEAPEEHNSVRLQAGSPVFQTFGQGSPTFRQEAERFRDPKQRAVLKAEQRTQIAESHQEIGAILDIDPQTERKLIDLLADFQVGDLEQFYTTAAGRSTQGDPWEPMKARARRETEKVQALRDLLGQEKLERYQAFAPLVNDYRQVAKLDARLAPANRLTLDQKQRLAALWGEQTRSQIESNRFVMRGLSPFTSFRGQMPSQEELQRNSQLMSIASNEESWRRMPQADEQMRQRAAEFLTPPQLDALVQMNAERADSLRHWIEAARVQMGMSPEIPDQPEEPAPAAPKLRTGDVKVAVKLTIDGAEATHYTDTVRNGGSVTFRCPEGLFVEVRPTMYEDDGFHVRVLYYEPDSRGGRRLIGEGGQMGTYTPGAPANSYGGTVVTGNRGYAIQMSAQVEPG